MEMIVVDLTRPDIGLPVVKVIVPGMRHFWRRLAPGRLYEVPVQMGWIPDPTNEESVNPIDLHA
jgi:ribosomal protein S12 methylthiotransferase accessory factor